MADKIILTGIKPTGEPHLGNYLGAIKPALEITKANKLAKKYFFIADHHALTTIKDQSTMRSYRYEIAATWLSFFDGIENCYFYFQSQVPQIFELYWILSCFCPKGLLNRAHAYKALVSKNIANNADDDRQINQGVFSYPVLMAADILLFNTTHVPVGIDQKQHVEIAIEIVKGINHHLKEKITVPVPLIDQNSELIIGIDGQKMSKNYNNTLPVFSSEKELKKRIGKIKTDSTELGQPLNWADCNVAKIFSYLTDDAQQSALKLKYETGEIGYGHAKKELLDSYLNYFKKSKATFDHLIQNPQKIDNLMAVGLKDILAVANKNLSQVKASLGF